MKTNHGHSPAYAEATADKRTAALTLAFVGMIGASVAATGTSAEFQVDLKGLGPWEMRTVAASEAIAYSSAWAGSEGASRDSAVVGAMEEGLISRGGIPKKSQG